MFICFNSTKEREYKKGYNQALIDVINLISSKSQKYVLPNDVDGYPLLSRINDIPVTIFAPKTNKNRKFIYKLFNEICKLKKYESEK